MTWLFETMRPVVMLADPRISRPCPFCGEREHLTIDEEAMERVAIRGGQVVEFEWEGKHTITNADYADLVHCQVCNAMAALDSWNHTRPESDYALLRDFDPPAMEAAA